MSLLSLLSLLPLILIVSFCFPSNTSARDEGDPIAWFNQRPQEGKRITWSYGEEMVIEGANLKGAYSMQDGFPADRELCFANETSVNDVQCFKPGNPVIKEWTQNFIIATIPEDVPSRGAVKLRFEVKKEECKSLRGLGIIGFSCGKNAKWSDGIVVGNYELSPQLTGVTNLEEGTQADILIAGRMYELRGHWFGMQRSSVRINNRQILSTDILQWSPTSVIIRPSISGTRVEVHNGKGYSSVLALRGGLLLRHRPLHIQKRVRLPLRFNAALIPR